MGLRERGRSCNDSIKIEREDTRERRERARKRENGNLGEMERKLGRNCGREKLKRR